MKYFSILLVLTVLWSSCERDDLCVEKPSVPLNALFRDAVSGTAAPANMAVWYGGDTLVPYQTADSISIPLPVDTTEVRYLLARDDGNLINIDTLILRFAPEDRFVSKACGFKTVYVNLEGEIRPDGNNWIQRLEFLTHEAETDTVAHIVFYH